MLGRKIFSILCLLALTVLLGACGSEEQAIAVNTPGEIMDNDTQDDENNVSNDNVVSSFRTITGGAAEFKSLVSNGDFISVEGFKESAMINYDNAGLKYREFSGTNYDLYDADYSKEGGFGNAISNFFKGIGDALTPDANLGSATINVRRTIVGNSIQREDNLTSEELLEELKTIALNGTYKASMYTQFGNAAFLIEYGDSEFIIDLNQPLMANPVRSSSIDNDGKIKFYEYHSWSPYMY